MLINAFLRRFSLLILVAFLAGCGKPPASNTTAESGSSKATKTAKDDQATRDQPDSATNTPGSPAPTAPGADSKIASSFEEAAFLGSDVVGVIVSRPRKLSAWPLYKALKGVQGGVPQEFVKGCEALRVQPEDVERLTLVFTEEMFGPESPLQRGEPTIMIFTLSAPRNGRPIAEIVAAGGDTETISGQKVRRDDKAAVWWVDEKTLVIGRVADVTNMINVKASGKAASTLFTGLDTDADITAAANLKPLSQVIEQVAQLVPAIAPFQGIESLVARLTVTGNSGGKLLELVASVADEPKAKELSEQASLLVDHGKSVLLQILPPGTTDEDKPALQLFHKTVESAKIEQKGSQIHFEAQTPEGFENLAQALQPALRRAHTVAKALAKKRLFQQIGLAFHNYLDVTRSFPGAGRSDETGHYTGLSWRVFLLPYLDNAPLYNEFKLNEPWDSEHNKKLIPKMPAIFKSPGVTAPGKTSIHVFTGPQALFADDRTPRFYSIAAPDKQILVVQAGPETAEIWTKPGGLDFDPKDPLKALGTLTDEGIRVLMADGRVLVLPTTIEVESLLKMIQFQERKYE